MTSLAFCMQWNESKLFINRKFRNCYKYWVSTLYTVPKAPAPIIPPFCNSDSFANRNCAVSGSIPDGCKGTVYRRYKQQAVHQQTLKAQSTFKVDVRNETQPIHQCGYFRQWSPNRNFSWFSLNIIHAWKINLNIHLLMCIFRTH